MDSTLATVAAAIAADWTALPVDAGVRYSEAKSESVLVGPAAHRVFVFDPPSGGQVIEMAEDGSVLEYTFGAFMHLRTERLAPRAIFVAVVSEARALMGAINRRTNWPDRVREVEATAFTSEIVERDKEITKEVMLAIRVRARVVEA